MDELSATSFRQPSRAPRIAAFVMGLATGVASLLVAQNFWNQSQSDAMRRRHFAAIATRLSTYTTLTKELPTDYRLWKEDVARPNSWRMLVLSQIANEHGGAMHSPWFSPGLERLRYQTTPPFCQPGSLAPVANAVISGGPGMVVLADSKDARLQRILVVEAYPDGGCWVEGRDIDLLELLRSQSPSDALQLRKANRSSFLAILSDFSCCEIKASIPTEILRKRLESNISLSEKNDDLKDYVIWHENNGFFAK